MSDAPAAALPLTALAGKRSEFRAKQALHLSGEALAGSPDEYARGLADGQQMVAIAFEVEKDSLLALLASAQALKPEAGPELSILLRETVMLLVQQIGGNIAIDRALLEEQIAHAATLITEADEARQIVLHPEDAKLVGEQIHSLAVRSDPAQPRGMVRIDCSQGWIEHGVALGIDRLREQLGVAA